MVNSPHSSSTSSTSDQKRLGRQLDYSKLKEEFYANEENKPYQYYVASSFVNDRIDRSQPLDRVLYKDRWFVSGDFEF